MDAVSTDGISDFHAHVYFDAATREQAWALREAIERTFDVQMGRFHEKPVGPHPRWMYQVLFRPDQFAAIVPWLALNRQGLDVLVHPSTGDAVADHTDHAIWLGTPVALDVEVLRRAD